MKRDKFTIWNYLIDLMNNNPTMEEGKIKIVESNDNYFKVLFIIGESFIFFKIRIEYSFFKDTEIIIDDMVLNHIKEGKRNLVRESDLIRLLLPLIRDNKLKRIGV